MNAKVEGGKLKPTTKPITKNNPVVIDKDKDDDHDKDHDKDDARVAEMNDHLQRMWNGHSADSGMAERCAKLAMAMKRHDWKDLSDFLEVDASQNPSKKNPNNSKISDFL